VSTDGADEATPLASDTEAEIKQMIGLFDAPSFVRRGHDLEYALGRLRQRLGQERDAMLDMVRVRLRQWASVATGPEDWSDTFTAPVAPLWDHASPGPASWADEPAPPRRRFAVARDLVASVARFNRRWTEFLDRLTLENVNRQIDLYNRYYVLEKECVLGSSRIAAQHFVPKPRMTRERLLDDFPVLPAFEVAGGS
jgi:hypothetical protein